MQTNHGHRLQDKRVVILGGTSGIGFATAEAAAREGAYLVVVSSTKEKVDLAVSRLPEGTEGYAVDLTNEEQIRIFFSHIGEFDHLVFTAGDPMMIENLHTTDIQAAQQLFNLRYWGAFMAAKYGSKNIRAGGSITLTSGIAGARPQKGVTVAASICGAVESLTRALAVELRPLRVNTVCFGIMRTEFWNNVPEEHRNTMYENVGESLPVGRIGEPEDGAEAFLYLMLQNYSTGQIVVVDGGSTLV